MSATPISLRRPIRTTNYDEGGIGIVKYVLPRPVPRSPEEDLLKVDDLAGVPSLSYFCIKHLARYYDQLPLGDARLCYRTPKSASDFDLLQTLVPSPRNANPRIWATLIQLYDGLPDNLYQLSLPLSHAIVPTLQRFSTTPHFSLITVLDLRGAGLIHDDSIVELKELHTLVALDISDTTISSYAVQVISGSLCWSESEPKRKRGPWPLRMLRLRGCKDVDDTVFRYLLNFPLLSVVDLRQTRCSKMAANKCGFKACSERELYYPFPIQGSLDTLCNAWPDRFSTVKPFELHIGQVEGPTPTFSPCLRRAPALDGSPPEDIGLEPTGSRGFYFTPSSESTTPSHHSISEDSFWRLAPEYRRPAAPDSVISSRHYDAFMLFRDPPPLSTLPSVPPEPKSSGLNKQINTTRAILNRSSSKFTEYRAKLDGLRETKRKRIASDAIPSFPDGFSTTPIGQPKKVNPFRRQSIPASMEELMKSTTKPLKPISQLPPPVFDGLIPTRPAKPAKRTQITLDTMLNGGKKEISDTKRRSSAGEDPKSLRPMKRGSR